MVAIAVGLVATHERRQLAAVWPWLAAAIALAILAPNLVWRVQHGWPSLSYLVTHHGRIAHDTSRASFVLEQLELINVFLLPMIVSGMWWMFRHAVFRPLAWIPIVVEVLFLAAGGKSYYAMPMFVLLYAAGAVAVAPYLSQGSSRLRWTLAAAPAVLLALAMLPIAVPVLPAQNMASIGIYKIRTDYADMVCWPEFTATVAEVYDSLPHGERARTQILVGNYGEAGAIDVYGPRYHLPPALSGHLTFYY